jgi:hypothetical protein
MESQQEILADVCVSDFFTLGQGRSFLRVAAVFEKCSF